MCPFVRETATGQPLWHVGSQLLGVIANGLRQQKSLGRGAPRPPSASSSFSTEPAARPAQKLALSDNEIIIALKEGELRVRPGPQINPAGVDLRIDRDLTLRPHQQTLVASIERVQLSNNLLGILHVRSSLAREGLFASLALVDPGFRGQLTVSLYNAGARRVNLKRGERFIQLSLIRLSGPASEGYDGKYQDSSGVVPSRRRGKSYSRRMERVIHEASG